MSEELGPCPFCGAPANNRLAIANHYSISCSECPCEMQGDPEPNEWNRRTPGPATKAMVAWCKGSGRPMRPALHPEHIKILEAFLAEWPEEG